MIPRLAYGSRAPRPRRCERRPGAPLIALVLVSSLSCAGESESGRPVSESAELADATRPTVIELLEAGQPVFGIFSGDQTAEQGALMGRNHEIDFVFYSLSYGPFDLATMADYERAMAESGGARGTHPLALRIPAIKDGADEANERAGQALQARVGAIVFPFVQSGEDAALSVELMGPRLWPGNPDGDLFSIVIIEDLVGIDNVREIVSTPGVSVVFPGPGDLRGAFDEDMEAVENAIQAVLAACMEFDVPCGITADADDVAERLDEGWQVFIIRGEEAVSAGRRHAGREG